MPKRKSSAPVRFRNSSENFQFFESISNTLGKRVSFDFSDGDSNLELSGSNKNRSHKRKKLLNQTPENSITLGEISFMVQINENVCYKENRVQVCFLIGEVNGKTELSLEISSLGGLMKHYLNIESPDDSPWSAINDLLSWKYLWILKDAGGINKGVINVGIAVMPEKMPISNAKNVVELFNRKKYPNYSTNNIKNVDCSADFFREVQLHQRKNLKLSEKNVQHQNLKPTLCPYQARAVQWMLMREDLDLHSQNCDWVWTVIDKFQTTCGTTLYFNVYSQVLFLDMIDFPPFPKGGILADEMGLGKTVAVIALVLNNPRKKETEEDLLSPLMNHNEKTELVKPGALSLVQADKESDISIRNKEGFLDPHEKLVYSKVAKGSALKRALNEWYNSALAEYSTSSPRKVRLVSNQSIKCVCGNSQPKKKENCVRCSECERLQHESCVGFKNGFRYFCPPCWMKQNLLGSNATLIITPPSIFEQWSEEIKKHVDAEAFPNGVFMYDAKTNFVQPSVLASFDIVISTYSKLRAELNHAIQGESRSLRNEKRFLTQCSPLTQIQWWRLCLDEAQMVEGDCSQINQMAKLIPAVNRWSVTGTPIQKSLNDIFHLIDCLRIEPFTDKVIWNSVLYLPYVHGNKIPLHSTIGHVFWRNSKEDINDELIIPKQTVRYHFLKFTAIEQNFYMREHATSSLQFSDGLRRSGLVSTTTIDTLDKRLLTRLLAPLLNLRQACSHPLAVKGNKITTKTGSMTLTELFTYLFNKTKVECEEELRKYIAALNGLAGIFCIQENWISAVEYYRKVLQIAEEYKEKVHVDSLQRIHTLTNLDEVLRLHGEGQPPTLRDDYLRDDAKTLEDKYMEKAIGDVKSDWKLMEEIGSNIEKLEAKFDTESGVWWMRLIHTLTADQAIDEVIEKITGELLENQAENRKTIELFLSKISSAKGIELMLRNWLKSVEENRTKALRHLLSLSSRDDLVDEAVDCHLRSSSAILKKKKCELCVCENVLLDYECSLFAVSRKILKEEYEKVLDGAVTKGSWKAHNAEKALRVILSIGRNKPTSEKWAIRDGRNHIRILEAMKKEFKQLRVVWMSLNHQVQARDELNMCKVRLRLRLPGEPIPPKPAKLNLKEQSKVETINVIEHHEVEGQRLKLIGEAEVSKSDFRKKYGTLLYVDNLGKKDNPKPEPCPICKAALENEWCVLQCGHSYCIDCIRILLMRTAKLSINCPVCREVTRSSDLSFVDLSGREENCDINVVGEHSTKVEAVVRTLLELRMSDENVKVLVFSTWSIVLNVLVIALQQNGITFRRMPGSNPQAQLREFKDVRSKVTVLLLPVSWGSKGLNLIEATHVFLVEPIMNPAEELQVLGRVHRIGQTRETFVHRFLIRGTIEEKIYDAVSESKDKWDRQKVTLDDLKNLFDMKNSLVEKQ